MCEVGEEEGFEGGCEGCGGEMLCEDAEEGVSEFGHGEVTGHCQNGEMQEVEGERPCGDEGEVVETCVVDPCDYSHEGGKLGLSLLVSCERGRGGRILHLQSIESLSTATRALFEPHLGGQFKSYERDRPRYQFSSAFCDALLRDTQACLPPCASQSDISQYLN